MKSFAAASMAHLRRHADHAGTAASGLCVVHCLLAPIIISSFPGLMPWMPGDASVHHFLACVILVLGAAAFLPGYRVHRQPFVLAVVALGTSIVLTVAWCGEVLSPPAEVWLSVSGSLTLITAHLLNRSFCKSCEACDESESCRTTNLS